MALSAPRTLKRCRPLGALIQHRAKHQRYPRNAPKTKCAASTKKTARLPACASTKRGSNFFSRVAKLAGGSLLQASRDTMLDRDGSADAACAADDGSQDAGAAPARSAAGRGQAPPP